MDAPFIQNLQASHLALWNEKDPIKREALAKSIYSDDIIMYDKDFVLTGIKAIADFIGKLLTEDPKFYFSAVKPMQVTQNGIRFFWEIQTSGPLLTGMDFFMIEDEKVTKLYAFMDKDA